MDAVRGSVEDVLLVDAGDFVGRTSGTSDHKTGLQQQLAAETLAEAMDAMGYDAIGIGDSDLTFGAAFLGGLTEGRSFELVSSSLKVEPGGALPVAEAVLLEAGGLRVGLLSVVDPGFEAWMRDHLSPGESLRISPVADALAAGVAALDDAADLVVLLAHVPIGSLGALLTGVDGVDLAVVGHETRVQPIDEPTRMGGVPVVHVGYDGKGVGRVDIRLETDGRIQMSGHYQGLDASFAGREDMVALRARYDERVQDAVEEILSSIPEEEPERGDSYVGSALCLACHADQAAQWQRTAHAAAWATLIERRRDYDPTCFACHSTGFGYRGGFRLADSGHTPEMVDVGCESCHGAGAEHLASPVAATIEAVVPEERCRGCHTEANSPAFDDETYRAAILH